MGSGTFELIGDGALELQRLCLEISEINENEGAVVCHLGDADDMLDLGHVVREDRLAIVNVDAELEAAQSFDANFGRRIQYIGILLRQGLGEVGRELAESRSLESCVPCSNPVITIFKAIRLHVHERLIKIVLAVRDIYVSGFCQQCLHTIQQRRNATWHGGSLKTASHPSRVTSANGP
jgi:hypothetical protein